MSTSPENSPSRVCAAVEESDEALFLAFQARGDRASLERLIDRNMNFAYRVAFLACRSPEIAEDAVQDSVLILLGPRARTYKDRGSGSFRGWFYRVVLNMALYRQDLERRGRARLQKAEFHQDQDARLAGSDQARSTARKEELQELQAALAGLPTRLRLMLALYYLGERSQAQIAVQLGISQPLVAKQLDNGLALLRARLNAKGLSATPCVLMSLLQEVGLRKAPEGLRQQVALRVRTGQADSAGLPQVSRRTADPTPHSGTATDVVKGMGTGRIVPGLLLSIGLVGGGLFVVTGPGALERPANREALDLDPLPAVMASAQPGDPAPERPLFQKCWRFKEEGLPEGFERVRGDWHWAKPQGEAPGVLATPSKQDYSYLLLPGEIPSFPFVIEAEWKPAGEGALNIHFQLSDGKQLFPARWLRHSSSVSSQTWYSRKYYFWGSRILGQQGGFTNVYAEYAGLPPSANRICLVGLNITVRKIEWRELRQNEAPADFLGCKLRLERMGAKAVFHTGGLFSGPLPPDQ